ncbi:MAG: HAD-IA family hydrolase [Candidatus Aminicenantes bacterium]|nr:HAD-IA family hydrolase [Candidatus Aminicenantes bacterium]
MSSLQIAEPVVSVPVRASVRPTLIFDFDGTLADTLSAIVGMVNEHADEFHFKPLDENDVEEMRGQSNMEIIRRFGIPLIKVPGLLLRSQKELHRRMNEIDLFPGIRELILCLKAEGFGLGILTSNSKENVQKLLRERDLDVFDFIHSESNLFGKNRALHHLMKLHSLKREEVVYVGDEARDIEACRRIPVAVIAVSWGFHRRDLLLGRDPDYLVDTPDEIRSIVLG